ncbi:MAG TPA: hypothetical protein VKJ07_25635, partial [Mycobacteriales bacterium]|nr:hypothetical protein [Mycobacteriales bacterium]
GPRADADDNVHAGHRDGSGSDDNGDPDPDAVNPPVTDADERDADISNDRDADTYAVARTDTADD